VQNCTQKAHTAGHDQVQNEKNEQNQNDGKNHLNDHVGDHGRSTAMLVSIMPIVNATGGTTNILNHTELIVNFHMRAHFCSFWYLEHAFFIEKKTDYTLEKLVA